MFKHTHPGSVDKDPITFSLIHYFCVTRDDLNTGLAGCLLHRRDNFPERVHRQSLLDNECSAKVERACPSHGEVVYRPVHCQRSKIAPGEKQRAYDEGIRCEGEPLVTDLKDTGVV